MKTIMNGEPYPIFGNIAIETSALCNRHCYFCPNDYFKRPDQLMSLEIFNKIIDELSQLNYNGRVELYIYNEPTRDKRLLDFVKLIRHKVPRSCIMISTNGDYIRSANMIQQYFDAGLNQMLINVYSDKDRSEKDVVFDAGVAEAQKRYDRFNLYLDTLEAQGIVVRDLGVFKNIGAHKRTVTVMRKFGVKKTTKAGDTDFDHLSNRSGYVPGFHSTLKEPLVRHCTKPFRFLNINWTGDALLCCNDYYGKMSMGNVQASTLMEIWSGTKFNEYRLRLQNKNRNAFLCSTCDSNGGYYPHMVNRVTFGAKRDAKLLGT